MRLLSTGDLVVTLGVPVPRGLNQLLSQPFFDWSIRNALRLHPDLAGPKGDWSGMPELSRGRNNHACFCGNTTEYFDAEPVVLLSMWAWLPGVLHNTAFDEAFRDWFGVDAYGSPQFHRGCGSLVLSPAPVLAGVVEGLRRALREGMQHTVALQVRAGGTKFDEKGRLPMLEQRQLGAFIKWVLLPACPLLKPLADQGPPR